MPGFLIVYFALVLKERRRITSIIALPMFPVTISSDEGIAMLVAKEN